MKTIRYTIQGLDKEGVIITKQISRISPHPGDDGGSIIHLKNGEEIPSKTGVHTLEDRIKNS